MRYLRLALTVLALAACKDDPSQGVAQTGAALPFLPVPPRAVVVSRAGSPNALQITFRSEATPTEVLEYYRGVLPKTGWTLESDTEDAVGAAALYALRDGHPIWIRISQTPGVPGATVELIGAVVAPDSAAAPADSQAGS